MKTFNHYKNTIEQECEEARLAIFEFIDFIDFSNFDSIVNSIYEQRDWIFKEDISENIFNLKIKYYGNVYFFNYNTKTNIATVSNDNYSKIQISLNVKSKLLNYVSSSSGKITFEGKPKVFSIELRNDIKGFLNQEYNGFDHVLVYEPNIDIDETIRAHSFLFDYKKNIALDLKGTFKFGDMRVKKLNLFNISNIDRNIIDSKKECFEGYDSSKNIEDLKFFFESIFLIYIEDPILNQMVNEQGLSILSDDDFQDLLELNLSF